MHLLNLWADLVSEDVTRIQTKIFVVLGFKEKVSICYLIISVKTHQHVLIGEKLLDRLLVRPKDQHHWKL